MINNVVNLRVPQRKKPEPPIPSAPLEAQAFVTDILYDWAIKNGIDIDTIDFKYECATIMTVLQGMLWKRK